MRHIFAYLCLLAAGSASAQVPSPARGQVADQEQEQQAPPPQQTQTPLRPTGRVATSSVGEAGQRQTRDQAHGIEPTARIDSRVQNRVQNRVRTRIDRDYDAQATTASPFAAAEDHSRTTGRRHR